MWVAAFWPLSLLLSYAWATKNSESKEPLPLLSLAAALLRHTMLRQCIDPTATLVRVSWGCTGSA